MEDETEYDLTDPTDRVRKRFADADKATKWDPKYFEKLENKLSSREDIHALILLNNIIPGDGDMIQGADHDVIYLAGNMEALDKAATDAQIVELHSLGVHYSDEHDCLIMYR